MAEYPFMQDMIGLKYSQHGLGISHHDCSSDTTAWESVWQPSQSWRDDSQLHPFAWGCGPISTLLKNHLTPNSSRGYGDFALTSIPAKISFALSNELLKYNAARAYSPENQLSEWREMLKSSDTQGHNFTRWSEFSLLPYLFSMVYLEIQAPTLYLDAVLYYCHLDYNRPR